MCDLTNSELAVLYGLARIAPSLEGTVRARVENCLLKAGLEASVALSDNDEALDRALANALPKIRTLSDDAWERACGISLDLTNSVNAPLIGTLGETGANALNSISHGEDRAHCRVAAVAELARCACRRKSCTNSVTLWTPLVVVPTVKYACPMLRTRPMQEPWLWAGRSW